MTHALVTGASGFIGYHLVKRLSAAGYDVSCFVRKPARCHRLSPFQPRLIAGDILDRDAVRRAMQGVNVVFHLAGATKGLSGRQLRQTNEEGTRNVAICCAELNPCPTLIFVSSLAAAGPARSNAPLTEDDEPAPVSIYGRSKRAGELAAMAVSSQVPTTIVRPPIVLGEGDRDGLALFEGIWKWGVHLVPGLGDYRVSVVHAEDLASALLLLADKGRRIAAQNHVDSDGRGIYFVAADETPTYAELGRMVGRALGRSRVAVIRNPKAAVWSIAALNELMSQVLRRPHILNLDKAREATAGAWICSSETLRRETGFEPAKPLEKRLEQTARWYLDEGWLRLSETKAAAVG